MVSLTLLDLLWTALRQVVGLQVMHPVFTSFDRGLFVVLISRLPKWKRALLKWHRCEFKLVLAAQIPATSSPASA